MLFRERCKQRLPDARGRRVYFSPRSDAEPRADAAGLHQTRRALDADGRVRQPRVTRGRLQQAPVRQLFDDPSEVLTTHIACPAFTTLPPTAGSFSALSFPVSNVRARARRERTVPTGHAKTSPASA